MKKLKDIFEKLGITTNFENITQMLKSLLTVKHTYNLRMEKGVLAKASELKGFKELRSLVKKYGSSFHNVKSNEETQKNDKIDEKYKSEVYHPQIYVT